MNSLEITQFADRDSIPDEMLTLPFEMRQKTRFRAQLDSGIKVDLVLERGKILRGGDKLLAADGRIIKILAAPESVSEVHLSNAYLLARICYHLGNRHVPLQIEKNFCRYQHDHVLDDMVTRLGAKVITKMSPFEPEPGAYSGAHSHYSHD